MHVQQSVKVCLSLFMISFGDRGILSQANNAPCIGDRLTHALTYYDSSLDWSRYQLLAPLGSSHGYGNWSFQSPEWTAQVGAPEGLPRESVSGLWSRSYTTGFVAVNPWQDRGSLSALVPPAPAGQQWRDLYGKAVAFSGELLLKPVTATTLVLQKT